MTALESTGMIKKKKKQIVLILGLVIIAFLISVGGIYVYRYYFIDCVKKGGLVGSMPLPDGVEDDPANHCCFGSVPEYEPRLEDIRYCR